MALSKPKNLRGPKFSKSSSYVAIAATALCITSPALAEDETAPPEFQQDETITPVNVADTVMFADQSADPITGLNPATLDAMASKAQQQGPLTKEEIEMMKNLATSVFAGDFLTIGAGVGMVPSYQGSDNYVLFPAPQIVGQVDGFQFAAVGPGLSVDLIREKPLDRINIIAGPLIRGNLNRVIRSQINDPVVEALGDLDVAIEVGGRFGVGITGVLSRFDTLSFTTNVAFDVAGAHGGMVVTPSINYRRPIGKATFFRASVSTEWADGDYTDYYFGIDGAGSIASGLPTFTGGSGFNSVSGNILLTHDLSGNAFDGGWGVFGLVSLSRLREDAAASPITSIRGDADQAILAGGVTYTF
ncbi:MipA/OmpV family protein [Alterisphingorhabdus coralli]|uniref:MipA/OmpV family protein n=1 Tax=Alterisphingorhabdus coralli TaxID=3071408 RepID=A0AA97F624_9SPHN|nr:MipA/OmpV family protein [Parasphingorhabdus sp. SCSIO 66989]WOE74891.1 MipA/OmpV family protein [Parasphingorhabdus sp. SCSIO 66989]